MLHGAGGCEAGGERLGEAAAMALCRFCFEATPVAITVSIGFHVQKMEGDDPEALVSELIRRADQALYLAKERGRNRTEGLPGC